MSTTSKRLFRDGGVGNNGLTSAQKSPFLILTKIQNQLTEEASDLYGTVDAMMSDEVGEVFYSVIDNAGNIINRTVSENTATYEVLDGTGSSLLQIAASSLDDVIDSGISSNGYSLTDYIANVQQASYYKELLAILCQYVKSRNEVGVSELYSIIDDYKSKLAANDISQLKALLSGAVSNGSVSFYGLLSILNEMYKESSEGLHDSIVMDTSSPFVIQSLASLVGDFLSDNISTIIGVIIAAFNVKLIWLMPILQAVQQWISKYIGSSISIDPQASTYYVQGPISFREHCYPYINNSSFAGWNPKITPACCWSIGPYDVYRWVVEDSSSPTGWWLKENTFLTVGFDVDSAWKELCYHFLFNDVYKESGAVNNPMIIQNWVTADACTWNEYSSQSDGTYYMSYTQLGLRRFYSQPQFYMNSDKIQAILSDNALATAYFANVILFDMAVSVAFPVKVLVSTDPTTLEKIIEFDYDWNEQDLSGGRWISNHNITRTNYDDIDYVYDTWNFLPTFPSGTQGPVTLAHTGINALFRCARSAAKVNSGYCSSEYLKNRFTGSRLIEFIQGWYSHYVIPFASMGYSSYYHTSSTTPSDTRPFVFNDELSSGLNTYYSNFWWTIPFFNYSGLSATLVSALGVSAHGYEVGGPMSSDPGFKWYLYVTEAIGKTEECMRGRRWHEQYTLEEWYEWAFTECDYIPTARMFTIPDVTTAQALRALAVIAAIAVGALIMKCAISKLLKKRAFRRAVDSTKQLNELRDAYLQDPTNEEKFQNFYKAARKYNRKASMFGWGTYDAANGWLNAPDSSVSSYASSSNLADALTNPEIMNATYLRLTGQSFNTQGAL